MNHKSYNWTTMKDTIFEILLYFGTDVIKHKIKTEID